MAQQGRHERQLMRQRGAGGRDIANADFGLNFEAGTRQERQLMRQRGAGNRQINNVDFGFTFNTPGGFGGRRSRTRSKTPGTATRLPRSEQVTPAKLHAEPLRQLSNSVQSTRSRIISGVERSKLAEEASEQPLRKRRRLSEVSNMTRGTSIDLPLASADNGFVEEEVGLLDLAPRESEYSAQPVENTPSSPLFYSNQSEKLPNLPDKENDATQSSAVRAASKKRKRRSIGQQSLFKKKRKSGTPRLSLPTQSHTQESDISEEPSQIGPQSLRRDRRWSIESAEPPPGPSPQRSQALQDSANALMLEIEQPKRRKKRKSIAQGKRSRRSAGTIVSTPSQIVDSIEVSVEPGEEVQQEENELNELSLDIVSDHNLDLQDELPRRKRRVVSAPTSSTRFRSEEQEQFDVQGDEDADDTYLPGEATPEPTPASKYAKQRQQRKKVAGRRRLSSGAVSRPTKTRQKSSKSTIPVLTYRTTNVQSLPTIIEEPEQGVHDYDPDTDELSLQAVPAITTRTTPNAVDVLGQACSELIDTAIFDLKSTAADSGVSRSDLNKRVTALQTFQSHLSTTLFHTSQSLDQRLNLEARLRKSRREKAELQARWLEIRKRRDQLDLRKDEIRRQHWENEILEKKRFEASEAAFGLEIALSRQNEEEGTEQGQGLELMLRSLAKGVSNRSDEGGAILQTLKSFNGELEKLVTELG